MGKGWGGGNILPCTLVLILKAMLSCMPDSFDADLAGLDGDYGRLVGLDLAFELSVIATVHRKPQY